MAQESNKHHQLKILLKRKLEEIGYNTFVECALDGKVIDVIGKRESEIILGECIVTQRLKKTKSKLLNFQGPGINLIICRFKKPRNNLARKIISEIKSEGIEFVEFLFEG